jgi:hypothetical protein
MPTLPPLPPLPPRIYKRRKISHKATQRERDRLHLRYHADPLAHKEDALLRKWGISLHDLHAIAASQGNRCTICLYPLTLRGKVYAIDHDHGTLQMRDIICSACNRMLGAACDDPWRLQRGAAYIWRHRATTGKYFLLSGKKSVDNVKVET